MSSHAFINLTPSPLRIGAFSATLSLHLIAFGLLVLPPRALLAPPRATTPEVLIVQEIIARVAPKPAPVPPVPRPPQHPTPKPRAPVAPTVPMLLAESALPLAVAPVEAESFETTAIDPGPTAISQGAQIAYDEASPPPYPSLAKRRGWEGTVLLRVSVDANGRPREVVIERSSGHVLLDRSASEHVLAR